ncbi:hypothetical protein AB0O34_08925 [Sphaerisporangium sp. NPDC088356]|uniref:hypothetical protein n=1 Tax=Sphaerisporangium sp. NPDC088356 TaxID=3154871 RepID=UPI0034405209
MSHRVFVYVINEARCVTVCWPLVSVGRAITMPGDGYRILLDCRRRSEILRSKGFTFERIVDVFALYHDVSPLKLHRYAHGLTGAEVVAAYNDLDPAGTAALRESRLYVFEAWPEGERRPSARALAIFSVIYQTSARRLITEHAYGTYSTPDRDLIDRADHRHLEPHRALRASGSAAPRVSMEPEAVRVSGTAQVPASVDCAALLRALGSEEADVKRRDLLFELALALGGAPALVLLRHLSPSEKDRLTAVVRTCSRIDAQAVVVIEKLTARCRLLDDDFGPGAVLPIVDSQRDLVADLLRREVLLPTLRERLIKTYGELSQVSGYLHHDLLDYTGARLSYQDALVAAHQTSDPTLITYLHILLSRMAASQGQMGHALDHGFAAQGWARKSPSDLVRSVQAMELARVLAHNHDVRDSEHALARSVRLAQQTPGEADPPYLYWWTASQVQSCASDCLLGWGRLNDAIASAEKTLAARTTPKLLRGQTLLQYADALTRKREVSGAVEKIRQAARLTSVHSSARLVDSVWQARARLQPWAGNRHVRDLDEELRRLAR